MRYAGGCAKGTRPVKDNVILSTGWLTDRVGTASLHVPGSP